MRTGTKSRTAASIIRRARQVPAEVLEPRLLMARDLYVDLASPGPVQDGSSWASAYPDLQLALAAATTGDRILVAQGTYTPTVTADRTISFRLRSGVSLLGGYAGYGAANPDARDISLYPSILSGNIPGDNSYHVVVSAGVDATAVLDGFTITHGSSFGVPQNGYGGGIYNDSSPTLSRCIFISNSAGYGAGMYNAPFSSPTLSDCTFSDNFVENEGGGMYNDTSAYPTLTNCTFTGNEAWGGGGGMYNHASSYPWLTTCTFAGNSASGGYGGGMYNRSSSPILINCTFTANDGGFGGGMHNHDSSYPWLIDCTFSGNSAGLGGGIFNGYSSPTLTNCIFTGNVADRGGALSSFGGSPNLTNSSFSGNVARELGGAIYASGLLTLTNCTLSENYAAGGDAIYSDFSAYSPPFTRLTNCIVWGSWGGSAITVASDSRAPLITYSDIEGGYPGTGNIDADPQFLRNPSPGADGQWRTSDDDYGDLRLQSTSPAVDTGNSAAPGLSGVTTDITGGPRITGGIVDMGAYELDTIAPTLTSVSINDGALQRSMVKKLAVTFSEPVTLSANALQVKLSSGALPANTTLTVTNPSGDQRSYVLTFSGSAVIGGSLADGIYDLTVNASGVQDQTGNVMTGSFTQRFHRLFGDSDGNKVVNALDYARLKNSFARSASDPLFNSAFDYEGNGLINALDLARFRQRYGLVYSY